jgi:long-subunit fatty acid transport protein
MPRTASFAGCAALALVLAAAAEARAQGVALSRAGSGARAAGMGDAFVAVSDDGTAASWNPAGLAQLRQPEFSFVYALSDQALALSGLRSPDDQSLYAFRHPLSGDSSSVDFASAAIPFSIVRRPVTLQVSWRRLYRLDNVFGGQFDRYPAGDLGNVQASTLFEDRLEGSIDVLSVAGAVRLTSRAALGASLDFWSGGWNEHFSYVEQPMPPGPSPFYDGRGRVSLSGKNLNLGLLLNYPAWSAGVVYHAPFWADFSNHVENQSSVAPPEAADAPHARFRFPRSIAAGLAWRPAALWTVAASVTHDQWTDAVVDHIPGVPGPINFFDGVPPELSTTQDTVSFNLGAERLLVHDGAVFPLRLGLGWEPQGGMDAVTQDPVNYLLFSAGTGFNTNRFKLDAAVQYRGASFRTSQVLTLETLMAGGLARDYIGRGDAHEWRLKVSAIYRIQDTEKLRGLLRKIFG